MPSVSMQGTGVQQRYTLITEREIVVSSVMARSPIDALQDMLAKIKGTTSESGPSSSFTEHSQFACPKPQFPVATSHTITRALAGTDDESVSSDSTSREPLRESP